MNWPNDITIERGLISALCQDPTLVEQVTSIVDASDFFDPALSKLFGLLLDLLTSGKRISSPLALANATRHLDQQYADQAFWHAFKHQGSRHDAMYYAVTLKSYSTARQLALAASELAADVDQYARTERVPDGDALASKLRARLDSIGTGGTADLITIGDAALKAVESVRKARQAGRPASAYTGLPGLDGLGAAMRPGTLNILAARPGKGKSAFAAQVATHNAIKGRPVLFASYEMRDEEIALRAMASDTGVSMTRAIDGHIDERDVERLADSAAALKSLPIKLTQSAVDVDRLCATIRVENKAGRCALAVVDYLQLVTPSKNDARLPREQQVASITRKLKLLANELEIPLLVLCQLNRAADEGEPKLSHLRESGSIEQDADCVFFLHGDGAPGEPLRTVKFILAKSRNGAGIAREIYYDGPRFHFSEAPPAVEQANRQAAEMFTEFNEDFAVTGWR